MKPKMIGCCTKCDVEVANVVERDSEGRPKRIGPLPDDRRVWFDNAMRANFALANGSRMDLTFCAECANGLTPHDLPHIWGRVKDSWAVETPDHPWPKTQRDNCILALLNVKPWLEVA